MANKTKAELIKEIEMKNKEIGDLKKEVEKLDRYKQYSNMADEFAAMREAFMVSGFSRDESYDMVKTLVTSLASKFISMGVI